jgi:hypothetical protein
LNVHPAWSEDNDSDEARSLAGPKRAWEAARVPASASDGIDGAGDSHGHAHRKVQRTTAFRRRRLVGRDGEIADLTKVVASTPLTTVTGPAGVGKTAIALAVAAASEERFPDRVFVVWLASLRSADHITSEVAAQVGIPRSGGESYEDVLIGWLAERDVLLVLDNCEHLVTAVADLVEELIARLPRRHVLATSREPLWVERDALIAELKRATGLNDRPHRCWRRANAPRRGSPHDAGAIWNRAVIAAAGAPSPPSRHAR